MKCDAAGAMALRDRWISINLHFMATPFAWNNKFIVFDKCSLPFNWKEFKLIFQGNSHQNLTLVITEQKIILQLMRKFIIRLEGIMEKWCRTFWAKNYNILELVSESFYHRASEVSWKLLKFSVSFSWHLNRTVSKALCLSIYKQGF